MFRAVMVLLLAFFLSVVIRAARYSETLDYRDFDATWHVLLTLQAMDENPFGTYLGLPIVTLGGDANKFYRWGAALMTHDGNALYVSFPPLGFVLPLVVLRALHLPYTVVTLMGFNFALHLISVGGVYALTRGLLRRSGAPSVNAGALTMALAYLFTTETLYSHGVIYWAHAPFQAVYIGYLLFLIHVIEREKLSMPLLLINAGLCFVMGTIEWTSTLIAFASGAVLFVMLKGTRKARLAAMLSSWGGVGAAIALFALAFLMLVPARDFVTRLGGRVLIRGVTHGSVIELIGGYFESFGVLPLLLIGVVMFRRQKIKPAALTVVFIVTGCAMLENAAVMQHAIEYTFDRLKLFYLIIPAFVVLWSSGARARRWSGAAAVVSMCMGIGFYVIGLGRVWDIAPTLANNARLLDGVTLDSSVIIGIPMSARGYVNLEWHRSIVEHTSVSRLAAFAEERGASSWAYFDVDDAGCQIYRYNWLINSDHGAVSLRYPAEVESRLACDLRGGVHVCSEAELRRALNLPTDATDDRDLIYALDALRFSS